MGPSARRYRAALASHDLRLLLIAFVLDETGSWAYNVVLAAYVFGKTGSPGWVAALLSSRWIVGMLASGPAGVISDRYDRRRVVQCGAGAAAAIAAVMTVLVAADAPVWSLVVGSALLPVAYSVDRPAADALVPEVVSEQDLSAANALFASLENLVVVLGPALGGVLLFIGEPVVGVGVNAASFLASAALFTLVRTRARGDAATEQGLVRQYVAGWRVLLAHRLAFTLVLLLVLDSAVFGAASVVYGPLSVHLGTGANGYSYLMGAQALGGVLGAALGGRLAARPRLAPVLIGGFIAECVPLAFVTSTHSPAVAAVLQLVCGVGMVVIDVLGVTALQRDLPREVLGRANAIMNGMIAGATAGASLIATLLLAWAGLTGTVVIIALSFPLLALLGIPPVRRAERSLAARVAATADRVETLQSLDLFTGASRPVLEQLASSAQPITTDAGAVLLRQGDPADALLVLTEGRLLVDIVDDGRVQHRPDVTAPAYVGEIGLLRGIPRTATVSAATDSRLLRIDAADFRAALDTASASRTMMSVAAERFTRTDAATTST